MTGAAPRVAASLYAIAYRPVRRNGDSQFDMWEQELPLGQELPTVPLWLLGGISVPVDLEAAYERTCREQRIPPGGFAVDGPG
jgi:hypothetical protein